MNKNGSMDVFEIVKYYDLTDEDIAFVLDMAYKLSKYGDRKYELLDAVREMLWSTEE